MLIDAEHADAVEAARVADQHPPSFVEHGGVRAGPRHTEGLRDPGDAQVLTHDPCECPREAAAGDL